MIAPPREWTARSIALHVLQQVRQKEAFVQELLDDAFRIAEPTPADRRLATQLVFGVLRRRGSLDALLRQVVTRAFHQVEPWIWEALRLGVFQLTFLTRVPTYSAINETVELAAVVGVPRAKGFLNANLRAVTRLLTDESATNPGSAALPIAPENYRRLTRPVLPDPQARPVEYLSAGFSLPPWLAERWHTRWGYDETARLGFWFLEPAPVWLRINPLRTSRDAFVQRLREAGLSPIVGEHAQAVRLEEGILVRDVPGYTEGHFVVQDLSAMKLATALGPEPGWNVLDLCAAPGGKTTHLAETMRDQGCITACDRDARRLAPLASTMERLGLTSITLAPLEEGQEPPSDPYDAALVDVPCSNTGVLGRRPEVRWRLTPKEIARLVPLQTKLLVQAIERVKPGGVIMYSTCSIEPEENASLVQAVIAQTPGVTLEAEELSTPGQPADGGYWARLRKTGG
jgi:16S rRNA (cytosine967-C5)-methyltransferase